MLTFLLVACSEPALVDPELAPLPEGFPEMAIPADNPLTAAKAELGRHLFHDVRLSSNETQACASCHLQELAFTDGQVTPTGSTGMGHSRNANGLTNVGYNATLTWANPLLTELEVQALVPLFGEEPIELGATDAVLERLDADPLYEDLFEAAFPGAPIDWDRITDALASFQRTLVSGNSRFDQFTYQGDRDALTEQEVSGMVLFFSEKLECHHCHGGFNFSEATVHADQGFDAELFHNTGLYDIDGEGAYPPDNVGLYAFTGDPADMGRFRAPSLRNVAVTAPYMHDGSIATLEEVLAHYERGGRLVEGPHAGDGAQSPLKSGLVPGFQLTDAERADLIAFLHSLTDETFLTDPALSDPFAQ
jgi:cytochrome c peroxidase